MKRRVIPPQLLSVVWFSVFIALMLWGSVSAYAAFTITADVDKTTMTVEDTLQFTIQISSDEAQNLPAPSLDGDFSGFAVVAGPSSSTQIQMVNFSLSATRTVTYILAPESEGELTLPQASVIFKGKTYKTKPITVKVLKSGGAPSGQASQNNRSTGTEQGNTATNHSQTGEQRKLTFFRLEPSKKETFVGEQIILEYVLYSREQIVDVGFRGLPKLTGFWVEEVPQKHILQSRATIQGVPYNRYLLKRQILFSTSSGTFTLQPISLSVQIVQQVVQRRRRSIFDDFFNDPFFSQQRKNVYRNSLPVEITVHPLPQTDRPAHFSGMVGEYSVKTSINKKSLKVGDSLTLTFTVSGEGNVQAIAKPDFPQIQGFKIYEPTVKKNLQTTGRGVTGWKKFEYILVPKVEGTLTVPPIEFNWFSTKEKRYRRYRTQPITLSVSPGESRAGESVLIGPSAEVKSEISLLGKDIDFIMLRMKVQKRIIPLIHYTPFLLFQALFFLLILGTLGITRWRAAQQKDQNRFRAKRAFAITRKRLKIAKKAKAKGELGDFYSQLGSLFTGYLADKLALPAAGLTTEKIETSLTEKAIPHDTVKAVVQVMEHLDFVKFAPSAASDKDADELMQSTQKLIRELEKKL